MSDDLVALLKRMRTELGYCDMQLKGEGYTISTDLRNVISDADKTIAALTAQPQQVHSDHPMRHYDRTCPACNKQPSSVMVPVEPTDAMLRPFYECPPDDLRVAYEAMLRIAKHQAAAKEPEQKPAACNWEYVEDGYWQTDCGEAFCVEEGTPEQNGMKYCHHCGKPLYTKPEAK